MVLDQGIISEGTRRDAIVFLVGGIVQLMASGAMSVDDRFDFTAK